jgi:hypothetical protein
MEISMKKAMAISASALAALACAGSLQAHHSGYMYETTSVWVKGTVVRFEHVNPHTIITLEDRTEDGQVRRWAVEGPGRSQVDRIGIGMDLPKVGDVIEFCAFAYKPAAELSRMFPGVDFSVQRSSPATDGSSPQFVAGHVLVMPDGEKRLWEPHGVISECIRSSDNQRQSWLDFLNSDPRVRRAWCEQRVYEDIQSTASLRELVEEINSSIDNPCD